MQRSAWFSVVIWPLAQGLPSNQIIVMIKFLRNDSMKMHTHSHMAAVRRRQSVRCEKANEGA